MDVAFHEDPAAAQDAGRPEPLLCVAGLTKRYGDQAALADISFDVKAGEVLGLIGPNGAGKTTLLEAVAGVLPADAGDIVSRGDRSRAAARSCSTCRTASSLIGTSRSRAC